MPELSVTEVFDANRDSIMALPGVAGVGIGEHDGRPCIRVMLEAANPAVLSAIPDRLGGYTVIVDETGPIRAFDSQ